MQHVGQKHLPLLIQAVLALLVADSSQHRNWAWKAGFRMLGHTIQLREGGLAQDELEVPLGWKVRNIWGSLFVEREDLPSIKL